MIPETEGVLIQQFLDLYEQIDDHRMNGCYHSANKLLLEVAAMKSPKALVFPSNLVPPKQPSTLFFDCTVSF